MEKVEKTKKKQKKPKKFRKTFIALSAVILIVSAILSYFLFKIDVLDSKYLFIGLGALFVIDLLFIFVLNKRFKLWIKIPIVVLSILLIAGEIFGIYNLNATASFVQKVVSAGIKEEIYNLYVLKESEYESISDLDGKSLGIYDNGSDTLEDALKMLKKKVTFKEENDYDDLEELLNSGIDETNHAIFLSSTFIELINEQFPGMLEKFKLLDKFTISYEEKIEKSDVDVTSEPFLVYISGLDTYGSINTVSRSDVNILMAINPKTSKVVLINTPRDYYVMLHSKKAYDKLTHAGIYGVEESLTTLEDLYATDIDFYVKVNFSSLEKIVDAIGGITVYSKYSFSYDGYTFTKGTNYLNGKKALAFSRCRKELPNGDISRGENQEAVIEAIIDKVSTPSIISKYTSILDSLSKSFVTNMSEDDIFKLAKYQLNESPSWSVESMTVNGTGATKTTYSAGKTPLYVMIPDEKTVTEAKNKLAEILEG